MGTIASSTLKLGGTVYKVTSDRSKEDNFIYMVTFNG